MVIQVNPQETEEERKKREEEAARKAEAARVAELNRRAQLPPQDPEFAPNLSLTQQVIEPTKIEPSKVSGVPEGMTPDEYYKSLGQEERFKLLGGLPGREESFQPGEILRDNQGNIVGRVTESGQILTGLDPQQALRGAAPGALTQQQGIQQRAGQAMAGQVGQFEQLPIDATTLDWGEAATSGLVGSIPSIIAGAAGAAVLGAKGGGLAGGGIGAAIGAGAGFLAGLTGGMISSMKSQRTDTTTAQQRVLDEGKQTLNDWATMAKADPANRQMYLANFNIQLALIDQAYRAMKLDTGRDLAKFETALPNLAEFESFYSTQGERDFLMSEMRTALLTPVPQEYALAELTQRRT